MIKNILLILVASFLLTMVVQSQTATERKVNLAQSYEQVGQFDNALRLYKEVYEVSKENQLAYEGLVRMLKAKSMNTELLEVLEERITFDKRAINYILLGEARWKAGKPEEADRAWAKAIEDNPDNEFIYADLADIQSQLQLYQKAIYTYKKGRENVRRNDNRTAFVDELSKLYIAVGDAENALSETLIMLKESGNLAATEARIYALMQDDGNTTIIDKAMDNYIAENSSNYLALELYSWYQLTLGNLDKALEYTIKADDESNADGRLVLTFASNAERDGKTDIALKAYQYLIDQGRSNKFFSSAIYSYTRALESKFLFEKKLSKDKVNEIIDRYDIIIKEFRQSSTAADAYLEKARLQKEYLQEYKEAEETLFRLIEEIPAATQAGQAYIELSEIFLSKGNLRDAASYLETAKARYGRTNRDLLEIIDYRLALMQYYSGNLDSAETLLKDMSKMKDNDIANDVLEKSSIIADKYKEEEKAKLYAAAEYDLIKLDTNAAIEKYETIVKELRDFDTEIWQRSHLNLSKLYKSRGNLEKSNYYLEEFITNIYDGVHTDKAIFMLAQNKEAEGKSDKAIELLSKILIDFPNSIYLSDARAKIRKLRGES